MAQQVAEGKFRVTTILGTVRPGSMTAKALALVNDELVRHAVEVDYIDPADWDLGPPGRTNNAEAERLRAIIREATGVVIATPEYHGSFASVTKMVIENLGFPSALAGKPVTLLGVAAGVIGAVKSLEQLRGVCSHVGGIVLPGSVSVANVKKVFDDQGRCTDPAVEKRIRSVATNLLDYIGDAICPRIALEAMVRESED